MKYSNLEKFESAAMGATIVFCLMAAHSNARKGQYKRSAAATAAATCYAYAAARRVLNK